MTDVMPERSSAAFDLEAKYREARIWAEKAGRAYWWFYWDPDLLGRVMMDDPTAPGGPERLLVLVNAPALGDRREFTSAELQACEERTFRQLERCGLTVRRSAAAAVEAYYDKPLNDSQKGDEFVPPTWIVGRRTSFV